MHATRFLPAVALFLFSQVRADDAAASAPPKEPAAKKASAPPSVKPAAATGASLGVARDPVTGALRPLTPEEARQLLGRQPLAVPEPQVVTLPDGTRMIRFGPEHASFSVARKDPDGTITTTCVQGTAEARAFLEAPPGNAPPPATRDK